MNNLPITAFREEIVEAVARNTVTVIVAETGAGKSTQVPQFLLEAGHDLVVTQPRRLAARTVAQRVAEEMGEELGETVGYRTAVDRQDSPTSRALFCTDGLALVRELLGQNHGILVLDEVHEWNENMEVLVAWAKLKIGSGADLKVVLMSATLEAEKLSAFFDSAPVISVPGRTFPVEIQQPSLRLVDDIEALVHKGRNVLVFQPGKTEIAETCTALAQMQVNAEILPLHGQLTAEEQAQCFKHYGRPKVVVSTNVAQTSVTIDDIDAVVDSGLERRIQLVDGVEGLYLKPISLADSAQRKGRAGRTKPGIYIDHCNATDRPDFPVAEILRKRLDQTVLRLAIAKIDMERLEFFHQPKKSDIHDARETLKGLGCMNAVGSVTKIGRLVNRLPVSVQYARMLVEAKRLKVVYDILTVAAIMEVGGITIPPPTKNRPNRPDWRKLVPKEKESDVMGQLAVWKQAKAMTKDEMNENGISVRDYFRAKEIRQHLAQAVKKFFKFHSTGCRKDILKAVCAGMIHNLYRDDSCGQFVNGTNVGRELGLASCVAKAKWVVGVPFDLQIKTQQGQKTLKLIEMVSKVDPLWLTEIAPQLVQTKVGSVLHYSPEKDVVVATAQTFFNGVMVKEGEVAKGEHSEAATVFTRWLAGQKKLPSSLSETKTNVSTLNDVLRTNAERQERARQMRIRSGDKSFVVFSQTEITNRFAAVLSGARRVAEVREIEGLALPPLDEEKVASVLRDNPDTIKLLGSERVVEYADGYGRLRDNPRVTIKEESVNAKYWQTLPDEGIKLPGGRTVRVVVKFECHLTADNSNIKQLKEEVFQILNHEQWDSWVITARKLPVPGPEAEELEIPFVTAVYGQCVVTGKELKAFGTASTGVTRRWSDDPWFVTDWTPEEDRARKNHAKATERLGEFRAELAQKREISEAKKEIYSLRGKLWEIRCQENDWQRLDTETQRQLENQRYECARELTSIHEYRSVRAEAKAFVAKVEVKLAGREEAKKASPKSNKSESGKGSNLSKVDLSKLFGGNVRVR